MLSLLNLITYPKLKTMRTLSEEEKNFTHQLIRISKESYDVFLSNIVDGELNNIDVYLDYQNNTIEYRYDKSMYDLNPKEFIYFTRNFTWKMVRYYNLLKDLEKQNMLFMYQESPIQRDSRFGRLVNGNQYFSSNINDPDIVKLILEYTRKTIVINQSLIDYVDNDFKTQDDIKHIQSISLSEANLKIANKSLQKANITIVLTLLIFIFGTIVNVSIAFKDSAPIKIDSSQLTEIKNNQKEMIKTLKKEPQTLQ